MIHTVLFDLDGTLLPMDQDVFIDAYFKGISTAAAPRGYDPKALVEAVWTGTMAMIKNDGSCSNEEAFWRTFAGIYGQEALKDKVIFDRYYETDFHKVSEVCGFNPQAAGTVHALKEMGIRLVLATNPIFPAVATRERIRWAGLDEKDFEFYTTYENCRYTKPNPQYYKDILDRLGIEAQGCLMVGNDATEDTAAAKLGIDVFLLTDCLINKGVDISSYPQGSFDALMAYIEKNK